MNKTKMYMDCENEKQFNEITSMLKISGFEKVADCYWSKIFESETTVYIVNRDF